MHRCLRSLPLLTSILLSWVGPAHAEVPPRLAELLRSAAGRLMTHSLELGEKEILAMTAGKQQELMGVLERAQARFIELKGEGGRTPFSPLVQEWPSGLSSDDLRRIALEEAKGLDLRAPTVSGDAQGTVPHDIAKILESGAGQVIAETLGLTREKIVAMTPEQHGTLYGSLKQIRSRVIAAYGDIEAKQLFERQSSPDRRLLVRAERNRFIRGITEAQRDEALSFIDPILPDGNLASTARKFAADAKPPAPPPAPLPGKGPPPPPESGRLQVAFSSGTTYSIPYDTSMSFGAAPSTSIQNLAHGGREFRLVRIHFGTSQGSPSEILVVRDDGKWTRVAFDIGSASRKEYKIRDGILNIEGSPREIALDFFDAEARFRVQRPLKIKNPNPDRGQPAFIDPIQAVNTRYRDAAEIIRAGAVTFDAPDAETVRAVRRATLKPTVKGLAILGPPGAGKSQFVNDLVAMVRRGEVAQIPPTWKIVHLDASSFGSGNKWVGETQLRILEVSEAAKMRPTVHIIDEAHSLVGAGADSSNPANALQSFKAGMANGEMFNVFLCTREEFMAAYGGDQAFLSRLGIIDFKEPSRDAVLRAYEAQLAAHGQATADPDILEYVFELSNAYSAAGAQPRIGIKLLEDAAAELVVAGREGQALSRADIEAAAPRVYKLAAERFDPELRLQRMEALPRAHDEAIFGLDEAKRLLRDLTLQDLTGTAPKGQPKGQVLFVGPEGTGKTDLVFAHGKALDLKTARINMASYGEQGKGTDELQREIVDILKEDAQAILFFDEIDKASEAAQNLLLALVDRGTVTADEFLDSTRKTTQRVTYRLHQATVLLAGNPRAPITDASGALLRGKALRSALIDGGMSRYLVNRFHVLPIPAMDEAQFREVTRMHVRRALQDLSKEHRMNYQLADEDAFVEAITRSALAGQAPRRVRMGFRPESEKELGATAAALQASGRDAVRSIQLSLRQHVAELRFRKEACGDPCVLQVVPRE